MEAAEVLILDSDTESEHETWRINQFLLNYRNEQLHIKYLIHHFVVF